MVAEAMVIARRGVAEHHGVYIGLSPTALLYSRLRLRENLLNSIQWSEVCFFT